MKRMKNQTPVWKYDLYVWVVCVQGRWNIDEFDITFLIAEKEVDILSLSALPIDSRSEFSLWCVCVCICVYVCVGVNVWVGGVFVKFVLVCVEFYSHPCLLSILILIYYAVF